MTYGDRNETKAELEARLHHKLTPSQIIMIAHDLRAPKAIAEDYKITISMVSYIRNGGRHAAITGINTARRYKRDWSYQCAK